ncbi:peptidylprolyl isomerase [Seonamhaeicola algicola]|uniref:Peptidylprolyl isomerase n=1 Tax=Seonamhaeicola algicola TaxID=1719036 RepID=A0A5C7B0E5_9FLAO|nr:peptidylprolyl isomerase [Seonamhaeicola algicola]TXE13954.1 peptidylprolyl isomerase [Seonamhaeicola algicola]
MKLAHLFTLVSILFFSICNAQLKTDEVLFTVANEPVYVSEFLRVYNKNLDLVKDESQRNVDEYLKLFTTYKLKLKEAKTQQLHEKASYKTELESYQKQLAKSFMKDTKVTDALLEEAYQRISYDVNANHILIKLPENANPSDTLAVYNKLVNWRQTALKNGFETVMKQKHDGKNVYGEALGYFSGFKMVYSFENAAFNTPVGEISMPFRTRFGYHIIQVLDKRKSRGERTVAHIMVTDKKGDTLNNSEERIHEIYNKFKQGEAFETLAKQFSDDKNSAVNGGEMAPFTSGQLNAPEFEKVAFELENIGDVSEPLKSAYGWHIVKLIDKKLTPSFEDVKTDLLAKVKRDDRSKLIDDALYNNLKKQYNVTQNTEAIAYFASILNENYFKRSWKLPETFKANATLFTIADTTFTYSSFGNYLLKKQQGRIIKKPLNAFVKEHYNTFLNETLVAYKEEHLEFENEDYAHVLSEYRDGLLLFDLMENTIWNASKTDSVAIKQFYQNHKDNYKTPQQIDAVVASASKQKTLKKVAKLLNKGVAVNTIKSQLNTNGNTNVIFTTAVIDANDALLPKNIPFKEGISKVYAHNDAYVLVQINKVLPQTHQLFEEAKGNVISDYQTFKENNWVNTLKQKYPIHVNQAVLKNVKSIIKNKS